MTTRTDSLYLVAATGVFYTASKGVTRLVLLSDPNYLYTYDGI